MGSAADGLDTLCMSAQGAPKHP